MMDFTWLDYVLLFAVVFVADLVASWFTGWWHARKSRETK